MDIIAKRLPRFSLNRYDCDALVETSNSKQISLTWPAI